MLTEAREATLLLHVVDVSDPRAPQVVVQTDLPHAKMRSRLV